MEGEETLSRKKYVYKFSEGSARMKGLLGGKGANLAEMTRLGLPVPQGFTVTTEACNFYSEHRKFPPLLEKDMQDSLKKLEKIAGKNFGDKKDPLLLSVRSGAKFSMPGMMDTVLNLGLNDISIKGVIDQTQNARFAYDSYRRFIQMFGGVVLSVSGQYFEDEISKLKDKRGVRLDTELSADDLKELVEKFKATIKKHAKIDFPQDPWKQLMLSTMAVFESWNNPRAFVYRNANEIPHDLGTAVNVQMMVFGNKGDDSGTGVAFTRNPSTGEDKLYGEYLVNAQGEDVVSGARTPQPIAKLKKEMPKIYDQLAKIMKKLEKHYKDLQDIEFTIEQGKLYMLQTRKGKRTAAAALKAAVDMVDEGLIDKKEAVLRIEPDVLDKLLHPRIDADAKYSVLAKGLPASPGAATGKVVFDADLAEEMGKKGEKVILTRWETTPDDIHGVIMAQGILTSHGGMTSHAAVVARGMGKPCVSGAEEMRIDLASRTFTVGGTLVKEGDIVTIDGGAGQVILGEVPLIAPAISPDFKKLLKWADAYRTLGVRTNADTPEDAAKAREFGAEGIGLCRTEHMFMAEDRIQHVRAMILAETDEERKEALDKLLPMQRGDFEGIFKAMKGLPVTIRLLDPPLHEFLPNFTDLSVELVKMKYEKASAKAIQQKEDLIDKVRSQMETNPMLGLRGCRLGITHRDIYEMQVRAIFEAAINVSKKLNFNPKVEVMIPLVSHVNELKLMHAMVDEVASDTLRRKKGKLSYKVGTMIEIPRAALTADKIAEYAEFFSFGTNDLTQTTFGFSRDDAEGKFLPDYLEHGILESNPFEVLDADGVGKLVEMASKLGRKTRPDIKLGICGEHGGEPKSVRFCHKAGLNYVSCSPYRVPLARLAAAQAVLDTGGFVDK